MGWFVVLLLSGFLCFTGLLVWLNRWWVVRKGKIVNRRWHVEAWLKWGATVTIISFIILKFTVNLSQVSIMTTWEHISLSAFPLWAVWTRPDDDAARFVGSLCGVMFLHWVSNPAGLVYYVAGPFLGEESSLALPVESSTLSVIVFNALVLGLYLLAVWVPYRKEVGAVKQVAPGSNT
jgi:hypothetical protein